MGPVQALIRGLKARQQGNKRSARLPVTVELAGLIKSFFF